MLTLGGLISDLEQFSEKELNHNIYFDFGNCFPIDVDSYRGNYSDLAINFACNRSSVNNPKTGKHFLELLKNSVGQEFTGYKGGLYTMTKNTPLHVANYGQSSFTVVAGVKPYNFTLLIETYEVYG